MYDDDKPGEINKSPGLFFFLKMPSSSLSYLIYGITKKNK